MSTYTATLNNAAKTKINVRVNIRGRIAEHYGLVAAILEAAHKTRAYKAARKADGAQVRSILIDGEDVTQF